MEATEPMEAAGESTQRVFVVTQPPFGARGDGRADDTASIQRAIDAARAAGGGTVRFPRGTYLVTTVHISPGMTLLGDDGAVIRRTPRPRGRNAADEARIAGAQKWIRTFTTAGREWDADTDSPPLVVRNLTFDGARAQQGPHQRYEQEQAHLLFLAAATRRPGRLRASVERCRFVDSVGDGLSIYTNCDVRVADCRARDCFRSGVAVTGGHTRVRIERLVTENTSVRTGMDVEVDGEGYGKSKRVEIVADDVQLDADFDVFLTHGSTFTGSRIVCREPPFNLGALGSRVDIRDSSFAVGAYSGELDRIVYPRDVTFTRCAFRVSEAAEPREADRRIAALHVFWNIGGATEAHQRLRLHECNFTVAPDVERSDTVYAVYAEADDARQDNWLEVRGGNIGSGFDEGFHMAQGGTWVIDGPEVQADTAFWWSGTEGYGADVRLSGVKLRGVSRYMHVNTYGPHNRLTHRTVIVDESVNRITTQYGIVGNRYEGGRLVLGDSPPVGRRVAGFAGDVFRLRNPVAGRVWEWTCTVSDPVAATWRPGAVYRP